MGKKRKREGSVEGSKRPRLDSTAAEKGKEFDNECSNPAANTGTSLVQTVPENVHAVPNTAESRHQTEDVSADGETSYEMDRPSLLRQLQVILSEYPDDAQILRELVQNAEDAGASCMKIMYDNREFLPPGTHSIRQYLKSPGLLVYNNAMFTEKDWKGIVKIYDSVKQDEPLKVGRFGLGFKSVFHMTDSPVIISGNKVLVIDPIRSERKENEVRAFPLDKMIQQEEALVCILNWFGFEIKEIKKELLYKGTIFWFPLRQSSSSLSSTIYSHQKTEKLLHSFQMEAMYNLLFLKNLETIEIFNNDLESEPYFNLEMKGVDETLFSQERTSFKEKIKEVHKNHLATETIMSKYEVDIKTNEASETFYVVNCLFGTDTLSKEMNELLYNKELHYSPYTGVAYCVKTTKENKPSGHIFCFLPLPITDHSLTGLPFHVNGFFALEHNRRHLKEAANNCETRDSDKCLLWNDKMIVELLPKTFRILIEQLKIRSEAGDNPHELVQDVYDSMPNPNHVQSCWKLMLENLYSIILEDEFIFSERGGGKWISLSDALVAYFENGVSTEVQTTVKTLLLDSNTDLVELPDHMIEVLKFMDREPSKITPGLIARKLRMTNNWKEKFSNLQKLQLLEFLLKSEDFEILDNIQILPLKSGGFIDFKCSDGYSEILPKDYVLLAEDRVSDLLYGLDDKFVFRSVPDLIWKKLEDLADCGCYQLKRFSKEDFQRTLNAVVERNFQEKTHNSFVANDSSKFDKRWIKDIWREISTFDFSDLGDFESLPIIPLIDFENGEVQEFMKLKGLYIKQLESSEKVVCKVLSLLNVKPIHERKTINYPHGDVFGKYIVDWTDENVMKLLQEALSYLNPDTVSDFINEQLSEEDRITLAKYFDHCVSPSGFTREIRNILRKVQMFSEHDNSLDPVLVSLEENNEVLENFAMQFPRGLAFPRKFIKCEEVKLANQLGASLVGETICISETLSLMVGGNKYCVEDMIVMMKYLQSPGKRAILENTLEKAKQLEFVRVTGDTYRKPADLFHPKDNFLKTLFYGQENVFPCKTVLSEQELKLELLLILGIKGKNDVSTSDIESVASCIDQLQLDATNDIEKVKLKSEVMITYMRDRPDVLNDDMLDNIKTLKWILPTGSRPEGYPLELHWWNERMFCSPAEIMSLKLKFLVGSILPTVATERFPVLAVEHFKWEDIPEPNVVVRHFRNVIDSCNMEGYSQFIFIAKEILRFIGNARQTGELSKENFDELKTIQCIPTRNDGFKFPNMVVKEINRKHINFTTEPYLFEMATEIESCSDTCLELGMLEEINFDVLKLILHRVDAKHKTMKIDSFSDETEVKTDLTFVANILRTIVALKVDKSSLVDLLIPVASDDDGVLLMEPLENCTYTSGKSALSMAELQSDDDDENGSKKIIYTHQSIKDLAPELGVPSVTKRFMVNQDTMPMPWGQEEKLTTRISGLLDSYADGLAVLKEMIQNGDDAGATKVKILYDERNNLECRDGLFDKGMAECQGPALWVYNDAVFEEKDFKNIIKLGGKTKLVDTEKIGKFGLGFCSVYNITDVPCIVSKKSMVIMDPHLVYLGEAVIGTNPGLRIPLTTAYRKNFPNQFSPFNDVFGCNLRPSNKEEYNHTLFRLPLRTQNQATTSDIRKVPYTKREVVELFEKFLDGAGNLLLFTQNVTEVSIYHLKQDAKHPDTEMRPVFTISKKGVEEPENDYNTLKAVSRVMNNESLLINFKLPLHFVDIEIDVYEYAIYLSPQLTLGKAVTSWVISWATGQHSFQLANDLSEQGAIPVGSVAVPVLRDGNKITDFRSMNDLPNKGFYQESHIFCFLPLPEKVNLPLHINGCFNVEQDRKRILHHSEDDKDSKSSDWNKNLLEDVITEAYLDLVESVAKRHDDPVIEKDYWALWPTIGDEETQALVVNAFYRGILAEPFPSVFYRKEEGKEANTCSIDRCVFLDPNFRSIHGIGDYAFECLSYFHDDSEEIVMDLPIEVFERLTISCEGAIEIINDRLITTYKFFEIVFFPHLNDPYWDLDGMFQKRNDLLKFALEDPLYHELVKAYDSIPVKSSRSILRKPCDLIFEGGDLKNLFGEDDERFPVDDFISHTETLIDLGMNDKTISSELLVERAKSVSGLEYQQAVLRSNAIMQYLENKSIHHGDDVKDVLSDIPFLPVMKKPIDWPLSWKGDSLPKETLLSPSEMHHPSDRNIVGSVSYIASNVKALNKCINLWNAFDWLKFKNVTLNDAISQLEILAKENVGFSESLKRMCKDLYSGLNRLLRSVNPGSDFSGRLQCLSTQDVICLGSSLVKPTQVAMSVPYKCSPFLYEIEPDLSNYTELWTQLGIPKAFDCKKLVAVNNEIGKRYENVKMNEKDAESVVHILKCLCDSIGNGEQISEEAKQSLFIPDNQCYLRTKKEVCFDDRYTLDLRGCKTAKLIHRSVNFTIIERLGIMSKRKFHLRKFSCGIPFGQKEKLVTRLRGIISAYPRDHSILNELLQNADDAGASEIHFVLDHRQHGVKTVFDDSWEDLQGPALCVFNDKCFSEKDLEGIQSLGEGSKCDDPTKTGKFGVGFNSVYHLTDVPSFISVGEETPNGGTFCVFDPHCTFVPTAEPDFPGMRYEDLEDFKDSFPDVYDTYLQKELGYITGTCFRLPLRMSRLAEISEIKNDESTVDGVLEMLNKMKETMYDSLLFLANVKKITISEIDPIRGNVANIACTNLKISKKNEGKRNKFLSKMKKTFRSLADRNITLKDVPYEEVRYSVNIGSHQWLVVQGLGFSDATKIPVRLVTEFSSEAIGLLPRSGVALTHEGSEVKGKAFCSLPLPLLTGLPVHINGHFALDQNRSAIFGGIHEDDIRFIWNKCLMEQTVANTYASALLYQKEVLQNHCDMKSLSMCFEKFPKFSLANGDWWQLLVFETYSKLIERELELFPICSMFNWKMDTNVSEYNLDRTRLPLKWVSIKRSGYSFDAVFDDLRIYFDVEEQPNSSVDSTFSIHSKSTMDRVESEQDVREILIDLGLKLVCTPLDIYISIVGACSKYLHTDDNDGGHFPGCICPAKVTPKSTIEFLKSWNTSEKDRCLIEVGGHFSGTVFQQIGRVLAILHFCMKANETDLEVFDNVPLLLLNDGTVQTFKKKNVTILSSFCDLFPHHGARFVHSVEFSILSRFESSFERLDENIVNVMLEQSLTDKWKVGGPKEISSTSKNLVTEAWLDGFWKCLNTFNNIDVLKKWCLLPCVWFDGTQQLISLDRGNLICDTESFGEIDAKEISETKKLQHIFSKLFLPSVSRLTRQSKHIRELVANCQNRKRMINCLYLNRDRVQWLNWNFDDCDRVLRYLNDLEDGIGSPEKSQMKNLPLFTTLTNQVVCLADGGKRLVVKCEQLEVEAGLDNLCRQTNTLLIKHNTYHQHLYRALDCVECYAPDKHPLLMLYTSFILRNFEFLSTGDQLQHLTFVRDKLLHHEGDIVSSLTSLRFIPVGNTGILNVASAFFSPHHPLFKVFCDKSELPPEPFGTMAWRKFMELSGMKTVANEDLFIRFAKELQQKGNTTHSKAFAKELIKNLLLLKDLERKESFLSELGKIDFIPPFIVSDALRSISEQFANKHLIRFENAIQQKYHNVVWTMAKILPEWATKFDVRVLRLLHVPTEPSINEVLSHIHKVCESMNQCLQKNQPIPCISDLLNAFYEYLNNATFNMDEMKVMISGTKLIHIIDHNIMVETKCVVRYMQRDDEIVPYLLKAPDYYGRYFELFVKLGADENISVERYCRVLETIKSKTRNNVVLPGDELKSVEKAITGFLFCMLSTDVSYLSNGKCVLFLLNERSVLKPSVELVISDQFKIKRRLKSQDEIDFMCDWTDIQKRYQALDPVKLLLTLPPLMRPRLLSDIVSEEIAGTCPVITDCSFAINLQERFNGETFKYVIERLVKTYQRDKVVEIPQSRLDGIFKRLRSLKVLSSHELETVLVYQDNILAGSQQSQTIFYNKENNIIYLKRGVLFSKQVGRIAEILLNICYRLVKKSNLLEILNNLDDVYSNTETFLNDLDLEKASFKLDDRSWYPLPGTPLEVEFLEFLINDFMSFEKGDIAVCEHYDNSGDGDDDDVRIYIFVRILGVVSSEQGRFPIYLVDVGDGQEKRVRSYRLYKLLRKTSKTATDIEIFTDGHASHTEGKRNEILQGIEETLVDAMKLGRAEFKRVLRRMIRRWHPDKNQNSKFCEEVFKHIMKFAEKLLTKKIDVSQIPTYRERARWSEYVRTSSTCNAEHNTTYAQGYDDFDLTNFANNISKGWRGRRRCDGFYGSYSREEYIPNPQPHMAKLWILQAKLDVVTARTTMEGVKATVQKEKYTSCNWICVQCQQAVEKALKSVQVKEDAKKVANDHSILHSIIYKAGNEEIKQKVMELHGIVGNYTRMRYPMPIEYPNPPGGLYTQEMAVKAVALASKVVEMIDDKYFQ